MRAFLSRYLPLVILLGGCAAAEPVPELAPSDPRSQQASGPPPPLPAAVRPGAHQIYRPQVVNSQHPRGRTMYLAELSPFEGLAAGTWHYFIDNQLYTQLLTYSPDQGDAATLRSAPMTGIGNGVYIRGINAAGVIVSSPGFQGRSRYWLADQDDPESDLGAEIPKVFPGDLNEELRMITEPTSLAPLGWPIGTRYSIGATWVHIWGLEWWNGEVDIGGSITNTDQNGTFYSHARPLTYQFIQSECGDPYMHIAGYVEDASGQRRPALWFAEMLEPEVPEWRLYVLDTPGGAPGIATGVDPRGATVVGYYCTDTSDCFDGATDDPRAFSTQNFSRRGALWRVDEGSWTGPGVCQRPGQWVRSELPFDESNLGCTVDAGDPSQGYRLSITNMNATGQFAVAVHSPVTSGCADKIFYYSPSDGRFAEVRLPSGDPDIRDLKVTRIDDAGNLVGFRGGSLAFDRRPMYLEAFDGTVTEIDIAGLAQLRTSGIWADEHGDIALLEVRSDRCGEGPFGCMGSLFDSDTGAASFDGAAIIADSHTCPVDMTHQCRTTDFRWNRPNSYTWNRRALVRSDREYLVVSCKYDFRLEPAVTHLGASVVDLERVLHTVFQFTWTESHFPGVTQEVAAAICRDRLESYSAWDSRNPL